MFSMYHFDYSKLAFLFKYKRPFKVYLPTSFLEMSMIIQMYNILIYILSSDLLKLAGFPSLPPYFTLLYLAHKQHVDKTS